MYVTIALYYLLVIGFSIFYMQITETCCHIFSQRNPHRFIFLLSKLSQFYKELISCFSLFCLLCNFKKQKLSYNLMFCTKLQQSAFPQDLFNHAEEVVLDPIHSIPPSHLIQLLTYTKVRVKGTIGIFFSTKNAFIRHQISKRKHREHVISEQCPAVS